MESGVSPGEIKVSYLQWPKATVQQLDLIKPLQTALYSRVSIHHYPKSEEH